MLRDSACSTSVHLEWEGPSRPVRREDRVRRGSCGGDHAAGRAGVACARRPGVRGVFWRAQLTAGRRIEVTWPLVGHAILELLAQRVHVLRVGRVVRVRIIGALPAIARVWPAELEAGHTRADVGGAHVG
eukprot:4572280-Prymnesium_polylepis.1